jgi:hypothetical protein
MNTYTFAAVHVSDYYPDTDAAVEPYFASVAFIVNALPTFSRLAAVVRDTHFSVGQVCSDQVAFGVPNVRRTQCEFLADAARCVVAGHEPVVDDGVVFCSRCYVDI